MRTAGTRKKRHKGEAQGSAPGLPFMRREGERIATHQWTLLSNRSLFKCKNTANEGYPLHGLRSVIRTTSHTRRHGANAAVIVLSQSPLYNPIHQVLRQFATPELPESGQFPRLQTRRQHICRRITKTRFSPMLVATDARRLCCARDKRKQSEKGGKTHE